MPAEQAKILKPAKKYDCFSQLWLEEHSSSNTLYLLIAFIISQALQTNPALRKGIKLDFKKTDILRDSLVIVQSKLGQLNCPLWINADIVEGPEWMQGLSSMKIVDANVFLSLLDELVPQATVSPGRA